MNSTEDQYTCPGKELDDTNLYYYSAPSYNPETHSKGEVLERGFATIQGISLYTITEKWLRGWRRC